MTPDDVRAIVREENEASEVRMLAAVFRIIADSEARSQEFARGIETNLLTAFQKFAARQDARWTATRILTNDAQSRVDEIRDQVRADFERITARHDKTRDLLDKLLAKQPPPKQPPPST